LCSAFVGDIDAFVDGGHPQYLIQSVKMLMQVMAEKLMVWCEGKDNEGWRLQYVVNRVVHGKEQHGNGNRMTESYCCC
jgi:hypothetical protein